MDKDTKRSKRTTQYLLEGLSVLMLLALVIAVGVLAVTRPPIQYSAQAASQEATVPARVLEVKEETATTDESGLTQVAQTLEVQILSGDHKDERVEVTYNGLGPTLRDVRFRPGDRALVMTSETPSGETYYAIADHVRLWPLAALGIAFALITVLVGRWQGVRALLGLLLSLLLIGGFLLPQILADRNPMLVTTVGVALLMAVTLYLIQGWNVVSHTALLGLLSSLVVTGALAFFWTRGMRLTGFGSEETLYLQATGVRLNMRGLLLAGMLLGAAGVLDDVVLAQAVAVFEIARAAPELRERALYRRGMKVGVAHLTSMVNTLVLAYASAALPLLILFTLYPEPWYLTLNRELIAEELVRTIVGSLGLMLAVPLTTVIAAWAARTTGQEGSAP
ncbi:MAG: YibE/F family protein [Anaerolineae bacterium]